MNKAKVMAEYNQFERRSFNPDFGKKETNGGTIRCVTDDDYGSYISYYDFPLSEAKKQITEQLTYFAEKKVNFEWKVYSTDSPQLLDEQLQQHGFIAQEPESFMVLDLSTHKKESAEYSLCTEVTDEKGIQDAIKVQEQVWDNELTHLFHSLLKQKKMAPESVTIYVIYDDQKPIASAWITYNENSPFAGIWGGSTIEDYRGQGFYSMLLKKRIQDAKQRGIQYLTIDASNMSKPIVTKQGFKTIATTTAYLSPSETIHGQSSEVKKV